MTDDFGYLNARIRVRSAHLLHEGFFREALHLSFPELVKILSESSYGYDLTGDTIADIDRAVSLHFNRTAADLPRLVSGRAREAVSLILMRADLANVKIILHGKVVGWSAEDIIGRLGAGSLSPAVIGLLVEAEDAFAVAQLLALQKHPLAQALREALWVDPDPPALHNALDRAFFTATLHRARELNQPYLVDFLRAEIDGLNLTAGVKLLTLGFEGPTSRFFLTGGYRVGSALFQRLVEGEITALEELDHTDFDRAAESKDLSELERHLRCILLDMARECAKDVLGAGLALDYIQRKSWEGCRIRLLARRAYYSLSPVELEKEVICE